MMCCNNCGWLRWVTTTDTSYYCEFVGGKFLGNLSDCCQAWKPITQTNADRIRSMTDAELAKWLNEMQAYSYNCGLLESMISEYPVRYSKWLDWLKEKVSE